MKTATTFTNAGWDFNNIWGMHNDINSGYPYLLWEAPFTWTGSVSSVWNLQDNWRASVIPDSTARNVIISTGVTHYPVISAGTNANCSNLTIGSGAILTIDANGSLKVFGTNGGN